MSRLLLVECSNCKRVSQQKYGFFSRKKIICECGENIDLNNEKIATCECDKCGNHFIYNKIKNSDPMCPVCQSHPLKGNELFKLKELVCPNCNTHLNVNLRNRFTDCPICGKNIDIELESRYQDVKKENQPILIKSDLNQHILIQKYPLVNFNIGSQIIVNTSQTAILFDNGDIIATLSGGKYQITKESSFLSKANYNNETLSFYSELYFVNNSYISQAKWGTDSKVKLLDPISGLHVELGAYGNYSLKIENPVKFLTLVVGAGEKHLSEVNEDYVNSKVKANVISIFKANLAKTIKENKINVLELDEHIQEIANLIKDLINIEIGKFGLCLVDFVVSAITTPDDDPNFRRMKQQYAERYLKIQEEKIKEETAIASNSRIQVETATQINKDILIAKANAEIERIKAQAQADAYRYKAQAEADEMKMKGYTYQDETSRKIASEAVAGGMFNNNSGDNLISSLVETKLKVDVTKKVGNELTKEIINGFTSDSNWTCNNCHTVVERGNFCPECGSKKPLTTWDCSCGEKNISSKFCPECGSPRPAETWNCLCGEKNIKSKFCPNCGNKR